MNRFHESGEAARPIFLVSTGRTGTKYFSKLFAAHCTNVTCYHESRLSRLITVLSNMLMRGIISKRMMKKVWKFLKYGEIISGTTRYIECNPNYYNIIEIINELFPEAKFIFIVRSPKSYIISHINWERQRWRSIIANRLVPFWQPMPYLEELKGFRNDYHQRVNFYSTIWERKNSQILDSIRGWDNVITLRFEDIFDARKGKEILTDLMEWLELPLVRPIDTAVVTAKQNVSERDISGQWDEECTRIVMNNNGKLMEKFGYRE
jgi:hypothetical protein